MHVICVPMLNFGGVSSNTISSITAILVMMVMVVGGSSGDRCKGKSSSNLHKLRMFCVAEYTLQGKFSQLNLFIPH